MAFSSVEVQLIRKTREDLLRPKATTAAVTVAEWNLRQPPQRLCNHHLRHQCRHHSQVPVLQTTSRGARGRRMRPLPRTGSGAGRCDRLALPTRCRSQPGVQRCRKHNTPWSALMALGVWACRGPTRDNTVSWGEADGKGGSCCRGGPSAANQCSCFIK